MPGSDILIFDDDKNMAGISRELLEAKGYSVEYYENAIRVLELCREKRPKLVILDVMMPGMDGLSACKALKADELTKDAQVLVVTSRSAKSEKVRAQSFGANAFLQKPYELKIFAAEVERLIGPGTGARPAVKAAAQAAKVTCWGAGGDKGFCLSLERERELFILDAGRGLEGLLSAADWSRYDAVSLLLTGYATGHWEGLTGARFSAAAGFSLSVYGPNDPELSLADFAKKNLPAPVAAAARLYPLFEGPAELTSRTRLRSIYTNAPGTSLAYRFEMGSKSVAYCPRSEIMAPGRMLDYEAKLKDLCRGADALVHNGRWSLEQYAAHEDEGDSAYISAIDLALEAGAQKLCLIGVDGGYRPDEVSAAVGQRLSSELTTLDCCVLAPGQSFSI